MDAVGRIILWSLQKLTFALLLSALGVAGFGLWVFLQERVDYDLSRQESVPNIASELVNANAKVGGEDLKLGVLRAELAAQQDRAALAGKVVHELERLCTGISRLTVTSDEMREYRQRQQKARQIQMTALQRARELERELKRLLWEKNGFEVVSGRVRVPAGSPEQEESRLLDYAQQAWSEYQNPILLLVVLCLCGGLIARVFTYGVFAPLVSRRPPVHLGNVADELPEITASGASIVLPLSLGDTLWIAKKFLKSADAELVKVPRRVLDWHRPISWFAAGLTELIEVKNRTPAAVYRATIANEVNPKVALTLITLAAQTALVLRPTFLVGAVGLNGRKLTIRRHWRFFHVQSWVRGQFGYFEFRGPCRLIVAAAPDVHPEVLARTKGSAMPLRRIRQNATIGFTPGLTYRTVRSGSFWAYLRGVGPLFVDLFAGQGLFLAADDQPGGSVVQAKTGLWSVLLRLFGL